MRIPTYLSFSAMALFEKDPAEFFLKYLSETRPGKLPQTDAMSVGSAFDAYVKACLHSAIFGPSADPEYEFGALFESQVEPHNRDFALAAGKHAFKAYKLTGAYDELLTLLKESIEPPRFEARLIGDIGGVPFLGKPDCRFVLDRGQGRISIVLDWKVRQYCSQYAASPSKGYMLCRDGYSGKQSRSHNKEHKLYMAYDFRGLTINRGYMENCNAEYADQCILYAWLLGEPIGGNTVVFIDELCAKPTGDKPLLRVANHRARVRKEHQERLLQRVKTCWNAVVSGHVFLDMSREDSDARIETLKDMAVGLATDGSEEEAWFNEVTRPQFKR